MGSGLWISLAALIVLVTLTALVSATRTALATPPPANGRTRQDERRSAALADRARTHETLALGERGLIALSACAACAAFTFPFGALGILYAVPSVLLGWFFLIEALPKAVARANPQPFTRAAAALISALTPSRSADFPDSAEDDPGLLELRELEVYDVMVHRTRILTLDADLPTADLVAAILESPFTRVPLYRDNQDNIIGVVHAKDLLRAIQKAHGDLSRINLSRIALKPWFVPDTTPVQAQLNAFLKRKSHFALVVDEYGEVQGLITLEDILEEIVGDIADEHDTVIEGVIKEPDGSYIVDGQLPIRDLNRALDWHLPDEEATTVAGLVIHEAKLIPEPGQQFTFHAVRFMVLSKTHNRITRLRIAPLKPEASANPAGPRWRARAARPRNAV